MGLMAESVESNLLSVSWNGFRIVCLAGETDWLSIFRNGILSDEERTGKVVQSVEIKKELRETAIWELPDGMRFVAKRIVRKTSFSPIRALSESFRRGVNIIRLVESARSRGFLFPAQVYLVAEKYRWGILKERWLFTEFISGKEVKTFLGIEQEVVVKIRECHRFGLSWGGDPHPGNFLVDKAGNLRGIDFSFKKASRRAKKRDWRRLWQDFRVRVE